MTAGTRREVTIVLETEKETCEELVEKERKFLMAKALSYTRNLEDAEDLVHDTLVLIFRGFDKFDAGSNFRAWAGRIMLNRHINHCRLKSSGTVFVGDFSDASYAGGGLEFDSGSESPENIFFRNNEDTEVMEAFFRLEEGKRTVFSLFHFDGYNYGEIAKALDLPLGTVKSRINRARQDMIAYLREMKKSAGHDF